MGNITGVVEYDPPAGLDTLHPNYVIGLCVILGIISFTGGAGNLLTIMAIGLHKGLQKSYTAYIAHLASVDLLISAFLVPSNISGILTTPYSGCEVLSVISLCGSVVSILNLMMISVNRYILLCKDRHMYEKFFIKRNVAISMALMWVYALAVTIPLKAFDGLGWSVKYHNCIFQSYKFDVYLYVVVCFSVLGLVVPVSVTSICYILIIKKLRSTAKKLQPSDASTTTSQQVRRYKSHGRSSVLYCDTNILYQYFR